MISERLEDDQRHDRDHDERAHDVGVYGLETGNALVAGRTARARFERAVMLGYAALDEDEIDEGITRLAAGGAPIDDPAFFNAVVKA